MILEQLRFSWQQRTHVTVLTLEAAVLEPKPRVFLESITGANYLLLKTFWS